MPAVGSAQAGLSLATASRDGQIDQLDAKLIGYSTRSRMGMVASVMPGWGTQMDALEPT